MLNESVWKDMKIKIYTKQTGSFCIFLNVLIIKLYSRIVISHRYNLAQTSFSTKYILIEHECVFSSKV